MFLSFFLFLLNRALQFPPEGWLRMSLNNGSITHLVIRPNGRVALRTLGDTGFMPPDKITRTWMSDTAGYPGAASRLFALVHSATVPLGFLSVKMWCCLKMSFSPLPPSYLFISAFQSRKEEIFLSLKLSSPQVFPKTWSWSVEYKKIECLCAQQLQEHWLFIPLCISITKACSCGYFSCAGK